MVNRFRTKIFAVFTLLVLAAPLIVAQQEAPQQPVNPNPGATPTPAPSVPSTPGRNNPRTPTQNDPMQQQRQQFPEMQRPIFLSGKVIMEDGTPPPELVTIERVCNGQPRPEGYTDSKGRFQIQLGQNTHLLADASVGSSSDIFSSGPGGNTMGGFPGQGRGISERDLIGCELRASLAGYRSESVMLSGRRMLDNPDVGAIILRRLGNVEGFTYSGTSLMAPKDAKKSFERGTDRFKKKKYDEAQKEYEKAVELYPKYAAAWYELGLLHQSQRRPAEARKAYEQALAADARFVNPYRRMAELYAGEQKWQEVADTTARVIKLNPVDFPDAYFYNSVANYNMQKFEAAEKSAAEAVKLDTNHRMPKAQHLLGVLMAMRNELTGAAENIRGYLKFAPQATDADNVRKQLTEIERQLNQTEAAKQQ